MNLRASDPELAPALAEYLRARSGYVVEERRDGSVHLDVAGRLRGAARVDVELYLRAWEAAHKVTVTTTADP